ncbi:protein LIFEGUARD 4 isoform X2 [Hevea brasiliensis]|uniref:protein LIFEGUARD 4 isoform X2 n=1 Tax=Hevea brasiliensis TaxID=3981 RepID=UPI0025DA254C|nr:protein LIFEGUARD 4 isoform X2 [Hevea brasiliensis]
MPQECRDVEAGESAAMLESPDLQQVFICKVYLIVAIQLLLTIIGAATVIMSIHSLVYFIVSSNAGLPFYLGISITAITALCLLCCSDLASYLLFWVLTTAFGFLVGLTCAVASGDVILQSAILATAMVVNLTLYTFWAASRGHDFDFLRPFLFVAIAIVVVFGLVQIVFPMDRIFVMMYGCFGSITFCCYIVCVTDSLIIKSYSYDKYIWAAVSLYVDIINLFLLLLTVFKASHY